MTVFLPTPNFISAMRAIAIAALLMLSSLANAAGPMFTSADRQRYMRASAAISARNWSEAVSTLNALAAEYPQVPEVFAARCTAQIGQQRHESSEADCAYALKLWPDYGPALYALGAAKKGQGKRVLAASTYRRYAALDPAAAP